MEQVFYALQGGGADPPLTMTSPSFDTAESLAWLLGERPYPAEVRFRYLGSGKGPLPDFIRCSLPSPLLSDRFLDVLRGGHILGWDAAQVTIETRAGEQTRHAIAVEGTAGPPDESRVVTKPVLLPGNVTLTLPAGIYFDEAT